MFVGSAGMFVVKAHSFFQQARLAITLAWVAGYTNIVSVLALGHVTSHVSGTSSDLGRAAAGGEWGVGGFLLFLLGTFLLGATVSGVCVEVGRRRRWESIYVLPITLQTVLLTALAIGLEVLLVDARGPGVIAAPAASALAGLASMAMGLQNATITRISSGVVRTTHVTGVLTDLGLELAGWLVRLRARPHPHPHPPADPGDPGAWGELGPAPRPTHRTTLLAAILASFILGAALGTLAYARVPAWVMFPPVAFLLVIIIQDLLRPIAEIEPSTLVADTGLEVDDRLAVYRLRPHRERWGGEGWRRWWAWPWAGRESGGHGQVERGLARVWRTARRSRSVQRLPSLEDFEERLPESARVIVLDLAGVPAIDENSALELGLLMRRLHEPEPPRPPRHLLLAGLDHAQVRALRDSGVGDVLKPEQVCPDVELAIARGLAMLG
jgi:uncharacterized membrane protein YoaK (UPF0700 family)